MRRFSAFVTVAADVISRLRNCPPQHMAVGNELKLATFAITAEEAMLPCKVKIRDRKAPVAGEVYRLHINKDKSQSFIDAGTGKQCRSRDNLLVKLYPLDSEVVESWGELRFFTCPKGTEPILSPEPVFLVKVDGIGDSDRGVWWIAEQDVEYQVRWEAQNDRVLFSGHVLVQLGAQPEREVSGAVAIDLPDRLVVYDRRSDRLSSVARAEHIRRTIGQNGHSRSFEFINLREVSLGEVMEAGGPERVLTTNGLEEVEA